MQDFLSGEKFEQMAREYNRKYGGVSVLCASSVDKVVVQRLVEDIYDLFQCLNRSGGRGADFDKAADEVYLAVKELEKSLGMEQTIVPGKPPTISLRCAIQKSFSVLDALQSIITKDNFTYFWPLLQKLILAQKCYFSGL